MYTPKFKPYAHQQKALDLLKDHENFALFMEMRTGKTKVILDDWARQIDEIPNLLVIAPGGAYETWAVDAEKHINTDLYKSVLIQIWKSGKAGKKIQEVRRYFLNSTKPRILLINVEALSSVKDARKFCEDFIKSAPTMVVIDESTIIKTPTTKRTRYINNTISNLATKRRILSGLPTPKNPLDMYSQMEFLDPRILNFKSFYSFRNRYAIMRRVNFGGREFQIVDGFKNQEELQSKIAPHRFRVLLQDCYDLPPKEYIQRNVKLTTEQQRIYNEIKEYATAQLDNGEYVTATVVIAQIMRLHQVLCGHTKDETGKEHLIPENKTKELIQILNEYSGKAIIWCSYDTDIQRITNILEKEYGDGCVARFWGGNRKTREGEEKEFKTNPNCLYMVATPAAGGRGRTWDNANLIIYHSSTNNLEHRSQSEERPQAINKTKHVTYIDLIAEDTVETKIIHSLRNKINMASIINGDNYREWLI